MKTPAVVTVRCVSCGETDLANWSTFGSEQSCLSCDAPPCDLVLVVPVVEAGN